MYHYLEKAARAQGRKIGSEALIENVSRRSFIGGVLKTSGVVLALQVIPGGVADAFEAYPTGAAGMPRGVVNDPHVFVAIDTHGLVTIVGHRSEMGTGVRTSLPMVVADEMEADWSRVRVIQAPGDEPRYGNQDTDGSRSVRHFIQPMRECGAAMRYMLEAAAAATWGVDQALCKAKNHHVVLLKEGKTKGETVETGTRIGFGELAKAAMSLPVPPREKLAFKKPEDFLYIGKGKTPIVDLHDITVGAAVYGADVRLPGMKYAVIARPPVVGGKVKKFDAAEALKVPGVEAVHEIEGFPPPAKFAPLGGIAVVAKSTYAAMQGREALTIEWNDGRHAGYTSTSYREEMVATARKPGKVIRNQGDPDAAFAGAAEVFSAEYSQDHMAQAAMEPPAALARIVDGKIEVWAPAQSPYGTREDIAKALEVPIENVTVHVTLLGGGFGRKSKCDFVLEAVQLSKKLGGAPVMLQWTREDDLQHAFYHTTSVERIEAALDKSGKVVGWRHRTVAPSILSTFAEDSGYQFNIEYGMGFVDMPFEIPNIRCENGQAFAHTRIGWFRSVSNIPRAFAVQSFVAELAHKLGRDPKDMLIELIGSDRKIDPKAAGMPEDFWNYGEPYPEFPIDTARLKNVVNVAAEKAGWGKTLPPGQGLGIAVHRSFVTYVAMVVHAEIDDKGIIRVPQVTAAIDCGLYINPERIRSQIEGAAVMGMSTALYSRITFKEGRVEQSNFSDFEVARMSNFPQKVNVHIIEPTAPAHYPTGVGEPGVPPFAPALCNAVFAATGKRLRSLPAGDRIDA
ncbi:molybdopterin cofactor-binding domain-containing protein [Hyphomicrobium sp.]|uniref:xanthine dehydrogenase family protein molybdopterin-binding subunit n=1 Tax=Hyphomicrobium sp. TaxID=82 RepID=UPI0025B9C312|nr:molybdopterin cofactor-binding domain-containing protein [Hyphomicrobium sp.]MCC7253962.1 xanthine dehydrogenase family protein molybdopterin-binding subunit [Hyphomicrobium sp.]